MKPRNQTIYDTIVLAVLYAVLVIACVVACENSNADAINSKPELERQIVSVAQRHGMEPSLLLAMAEVESRMNPDAIGSLGEIGLFQLRPEYHDVKRGNVRGNIEAAARYLTKLKNSCRDYGDAFFVCYNYGTSRRLKHPHLFPYYLKVKAAIKRRSQLANTYATRD